MLSGRADSGESRMREICMSGSTRERGAAVIDAIVFHSVLSSLLYRDLAKKKPVVNNSLLPGAKPNAYELEKICSVDCWCCSRHRACARSDPENPTLTKGQSRYDDPTDQFRLCRRRIHSREIHLRWRGRF